LDFLESLVFFAIGHLAVCYSSRPACKNLQSFLEEIGGIREAALKLVRGENENLAWDEGCDRSCAFPSSKPGDLAKKFPWLDNIYLLASFAHGATTGKEHVSSLSIVALSKEWFTWFKSARQACGFQTSPSLITGQHSVTLASRLWIVDIRRHVTGRTQAPLAFAAPSAE
jgi:hypothetical protein